MSALITHSDSLFGEGVLAETLAHFEMEAAKDGSSEAWTRAYQETEGVNFLWIVYTSRLRSAGQQNTGLFESIAIGNQLSRLMRGLDENESRQGAAANYRAGAKQAYDSAVAEMHRKARDAAVVREVSEW